MQTLKFGNWPPWRSPTLHYAGIAVCHVHGQPWERLLVSSLLNSGFHWIAQEEGIFHCVGRLLGWYDTVIDIYMQRYFCRCTLSFNRPKSTWSLHFLVNFHSGALLYKVKHMRRIAFQNAFPSHCSLLKVAFKQHCLHRLPSPPRPNALQLPLLGSHRPCDRMYQGHAATYSHAMLLSIHRSWFARPSC